MQASVLADIEGGCNASQAAKAMFTHRNTLLYRLATAQRLLPRPPKENLVNVAVSLMMPQSLGRPPATPADVLRPVVDQTAPTGPGNRRPPQQSSYLELSAREPMPILH